MFTTTGTNLITYVACRACGAVNRARLDRRDAATPQCAKCKTALPLHGAVSDLNSSALRALVDKSPLPVVVDFWAQWCGPCKVFAPTFERVAKELAGQTVFAKLDTEKEQAAASAHHIRSIPTLIAFKNGVEVGRQSGVLPQSAFASWLRQAIS